MAASHSCMSKTFYKQHMLPQMKKIFLLSVTSTSLLPLSNTLILGLAFMQKHKIGFEWSDTGYLLMAGTC